jgi:hypothetical protein
MLVGCAEKPAATKMAKDPWKKGGPTLTLILKSG